MPWSCRRRWFHYFVGADKLIGACLACVVVNWCRHACDFDRRCFLRRFMILSLVSWLGGFHKASQKLETPRRTTSQPDNHFGAGVAAVVM